MMDELRRDPRPAIASGSGRKVIQDLDHAREVARDTVGAEWDGKIQHSEPQVIVACAVIVNEMAEQIDKLTDAVATLEGRINEIEGAL